MMDDDIVEAAKNLLDICKRKNLTIATAESCTAGLVAGTLTEIPGVSSMLDRGYRHLLERSQAADARRLPRHSGPARRGQPRNRGSDGARRAWPIAGRHRGVGHRHCRAGRRKRGKAGRTGAFSPRPIAGRQADRMSRSAMAISAAQRCEALGAASIPHAARPRGRPGRASFPKEVS